MTPVTFVWRKYDGTPHWVHYTHHLGGDEYGEWFIQLQGEQSSRPGLSYVTETEVMVVVPHGGGWVAKIFPDGRDDNMKLYIDLAYDVHFDRTRKTVTAIDMDLDVIKLSTGRLFIDDRDEFEQHGLTMAYPQELVRFTERAAEELYESIRSGETPLFTLADGWHKHYSTLS